MRYSVFVSHSMRQEDLGLVYETARQAHARGIDCYIAERDYNFGHSLPQKIETAIKVCDCLIAFYTHGGAYSPFVNQEIGFARAHKKLRILIVEKGIKVSGFDVDKEYIELDRLDPRKAIATLNYYLSRLKADKEQKGRNGLFFVIGVIGLLILAGKSKS